MKKVRFLSTTMDDSDCHSPRPYIRMGLDNATAEVQSTYPSRISPNLDPVTLYETSNSIPYPVVSKSVVCESNWGNKENINIIQPSDQLNLSFLDSSYVEPRKPMFSKTTALQPFVRSTSLDSGVPPDMITRAALKPIENQSPILPEKQIRLDNSFFIRRDKIDKVPSIGTGNLNKDFAMMTLSNENVTSKKTEMMRKLSMPTYSNNMHLGKMHQAAPKDNCCQCHHCRPMMHQPTKTHLWTNNYHGVMMPNEFPHSNPPICNQANCHLNCAVKIAPPPVANCNCKSATSQNAMENKTKAIEKYEKSRQADCTDIEKTNTVSKEKREPTVADLFKIIKLQNEQLQMLQEKVDRFISTSTQAKPMLPVQNYVTEKLTVETVEDNHKISIGVMTSFEVRTSTVFNKEVVKSQNVQVTKMPQNSKSDTPAIPNFLEGIPPVNSPQGKEVDVSNSLYDSDGMNNKSPEKREKTMNEYSLYNVQVDNAVTPLLSPDQTMYLDVRDYSDSDSTSDDQSNVGWTYYNKIMTHVNGMLQDSDMPSSASALCRARRDCAMQLQIDQTNVSVMKRVKFGDEVCQAPATDTSMRMNQLAAKYLQTTPRLTPTNTEMSFATRRYMEKHQLLQGMPMPAPSPQEMPRFLDITALKQQPKFL